MAILSFLSDIRHSKNKFLFYIFFQSLIGCIFLVMDSLLYFKVNEFIIDEFIDNYTLLIALTQGIFKISLYMLHDKKHKLLRKKIAEEFWPIQCASEKVQNEISKITKVATSTHLLMFGLLAVNQILFAAFPVVSAKDDEKSLTLIMWLPFRVTKSSTEAIIKLILSVLIIPNQTCWFCFDTLYSYFTLHLSIQYILLRYRLNKLTTFQDDTVKNDLEMMDNKIFEEEINKRINLCIEHHKNLLWFGKQLQSCFSIPASLQLCLSVSGFCFLGYHFLGGEKYSFLQIYMYGSFLANMVMELFLYCLPGSFLEYQSEEICNSLYQSKWYLGNIKFRKSVIMVQNLSQNRPMQILASGTIQLNNNCIIQCYKLAFSCITLLEAFKEKQ